MAVITAIANQKGGVAKTTSTINLAYALSQRGQRVLAIDLDPQANLTIYSGHRPNELEREKKTVYHALRVGDDARPLSDLIVEADSYDLIPSSIRLSQGSVELANEPLAGPTMLRELIDGIHDRYDHILIDTQPTLGFLPVNALVAATLVLIPVSTDPISVMGVPQLMQTIRNTRRRANARLTIIGLLPTKYNTGYTEDNNVLGDLTEIAGEIGIRVFNPVNRSTKFDKAAAEGRPALELFPDAPGIGTYFEVADAIINHG